MNSSKKTTVADYIVDFLYSMGVRNIFMLSGTGSVQLDDAFARKEGMKYICARHEATAIVMAEAVAKLKNIIGVSVVTTGPGGTNAIPGVVEAWVDSTPILVISGQVSSDTYIKDRAFGIQGFNIIDNVKNITKYSAMLTNPEDIRYHLERAVHEAFSGRPGPVWIDIPMDLQAKEICIEDLKGFEPNEDIENKTTNSDLNKLFDLLDSSKKPLVAFGRGVKLSKTARKLQKFLEDYGIPSVSARMANDVLSLESPYYCGMGGIRGRRSAVAAMNKCDLLLTLGTSNCYTFFGKDGECLSPDVKLVAVDINKDMFSRDDLNLEHGVQCDLNVFFDYANNRENTIIRDSWLEECKTIKTRNPMITEELKKDPINSYYLADVLSRLTGPNHIFTNDAGSSNYISSQALKLNNGQKELTSGAFYTMGLTLPLAIGAAVQEPTKQIIAITGDGSIELNIQELQTINLNNLNIKIIVINNGGYASIRDSQDAMCGGRYTDDEQILNFKKIANAFNLDFEIIQSVTNLQEKLELVLQNNRPTIVEVVCDDAQYMIQPTKEELL